MVTSLRGQGLFQGIWSTTGHASVIEVASQVRPGFVCFDTQHGLPLSQLTPTVFSALARSDVPGLVRVSENNPAVVGRALDIGASGVMVPMVNTAEDAERFVDACRYAPGGSRSYGMQSLLFDPFSPDYEPLCVVQIETAEAIANLDEIAAVEGVDWLYVGPSDLGLSVCGVPAGDVSSVFDGSHPYAEDLVTALKRVVTAAESNGVVPGLHCGSGEAGQIAQAHGFRAMSIATDTAEMKTGLVKQFETARRNTPPQGDTA